MEFFSLDLSVKSLELRKPMNSIWRIGPRNLLSHWLSKQLPSRNACILERVELLDWRRIGVLCQGNLQASSISPTLLDAALDHTVATTRIRPGSLLSLRNHPSKSQWRNPFQNSCCYLSQGKILHSQNHWKIFHNLISSYRLYFAKHNRCMKGLLLNLIYFTNNNKI